jgi:DNA helicase-2/ATP-dependent DNA helicase PcrA
VKLTPEQREILGSLQGPLRIAAGAGTGKTDTLRLAIVELIKRGVRPGEILCLTFTVEATKEMRRRVYAEFADRTDLDPDELTVQTYHAFAASLLNQHALLAGLDGTPALLDDARAWQLALEALDRCSFNELEISSVGYFVGKLLALNEEMQRHVVSVADVAEWCSQRSADEVARQRSEALHGIECYETLKRERNAIDFGDQIVLAIQLLRNGPELCDRLHARYRYVFLDEYQDTDVAQRELIKLLGAGAELVCAVGDVDQGIFGWRGASIHNMFSFPDDFPGAKLETLSVNFRSGQRILDLANVIVDKFQRPRGELREPLKECEDAPEATIEAFVAPHQLEEAGEIAKRIATAGPPWSEYAVLTRRRSEFGPIFHALSAHGVPVEVDELGGFWTRPEIIDVIAWLRVLADPGDNLALVRLLLGPAYRLSRRDLYFLARLAKDENRRLRYGDSDALPYALADSLVAHDEITELSDEACSRIDDFHHMWRQLSTIAARVPLADLVGEIARVTGLAGELAASPDPEAEIALRHLARLRDLSRDFQPVAGASDLAGFVAYLDSVEEVDQEEDQLRTIQEDAVQLLTFHGAKGHEWETVFLAGIATGIIPSEKWSENPVERWWRLPFDLRGDRDFLPTETKAGLEQLHNEEERRLMYVGATRAKRRLILSRAWFYGDNIRAKLPSVFWDEAQRFIDELEHLDCPPSNPHPLGVETPEAAPRPLYPLVRDEEAIARLHREAEKLRALESTQPTATTWRPPSTLSVTAFLTFVHDPNEFFWRYVRRVPSPPSPAAQLGIELHHRIEQRARGLVPLGASSEELDEPYDLDIAERRGDAEALTADQLWANFERSRFAQMAPLMVEQPFALYIGSGISLTGRIDAIFERPDGNWDIVDYKTGASDPDPLQLHLYRQAVHEIWQKTAHCSWLLLRDGTEESPPWNGSEVALVREGAQRLAALADASAESLI